MGYLQGLWLLNYLTFRVIVYEVDNNKLHLRLARVGPFRAQFGR